MLYTSSGLSSSTNYFFVQLRTRWGREKAGAKSDMCPKSALRVREEREGQQNAQDNVTEIQLLLLLILSFISHSRSLSSPQSKFGIFVSVSC